MVNILFINDQAVNSENYYTMHLDENGYIGNYIYSKSNGRWTSIFHILIYYTVIDIEDFLDYRININGLEMIVIEEKDLGDDWREYLD